MSLAEKLRKTTDNVREGRRVYNRRLAEVAFKDAQKSLEKAAQEGKYSTEISFRLVDGVDVVGSHDFQEAFKKLLEDEGFYVDIFGTDLFIIDWAERFNLAPLMTPPTRTVDEEKIPSYPPWQVT